MAGITGQGTTFNLPNFVGELFAVTPTDTPFLSAIGGLTGGVPADGTLFQWQGYDLRAADATRQRVEGAAAPTAEQRVRFNVNNVVEVHQEALEVSYTKLAATGQFNSTGSTHPGSVGLGGSNPVLDEMDWQTNQALIQIARDIEKGFTVGTFNNPADNSTARRTRGIMQATATNAADKGVLVGNGASTIATNGTITEVAHGLVVGDYVVARALGTGAIGVLEVDQLYYVLTAPTADTFTLAPRLGGSTITFAGTGTADFYKATVLTEAMVSDLLQLVWENGGIQVSETATIMVGGLLKRALTKIYITDKGYQESSRVVGGVHVMTIETDFGILNIMLNRYFPTGALQVVSLDECAPAFLPIPDKGFLFAEPLAKVGAAERSQIYGEVGLRYGNEKSHGKLLGVRARSRLTPKEPIMDDSVTMFDPASERTQQASADAFDRVWSQEGWQLVDGESPAADQAEERRQALLLEAEELGIKVRSNAKAETIAARIAEHRGENGNDDPDDEDDLDGEDDTDI